MLPPGEAAIRLARIGFDNTFGFLKGGVAAWKSAGGAVDSIITVGVEEFALALDPHILDVRKESEFNSEPIIGAYNVPLDYWQNQLAKIDKTQLYYVHCAGGYRSMLFISILKNLGFENLIDVAGGFNEIKESGKFTISEYVVASTMP